MINKYYQMLRNHYRTPEITKLDSPEIISFLKNRENNLDYSQRWKVHKYSHSVKVLRAGIDIMNREPELAEISPEVKQNWMAALLVHDIGRANEINSNKQKIYKHAHGAEGLQMLVESGETSLNILIPVLLHDQMNSAFLNSNDADLSANPRFQAMPEQIQASIQNLRKRYDQTSAEEKNIIDLGCKLVADADKLGNLREANRMLDLSVLPLDAKITPLVIEQVHQHGFVNFNDMNSYPDEAVAYMAWSYKFNFASAQKEVIEGGTIDKIYNYTVQEIKKANPNQDMTAFKKEFRAVTDYVVNYHQAENAKVLPANKDASVQMINKFLHSSKGK